MGRELVSVWTSVEQLANVEWLRRWITTNRAEPCRPAILIGHSLGACVGIEAALGRRPKLLDLFRKAPTVTNFRSYEKELDQASWLTRLTRPAMQFLRFVALRETPEQVLPGRGPWFFYRPAVQYYVEPLPSKNLSGQVPDDPVPAITACVRVSQRVQRFTECLTAPLASNGAPSCAAPCA